jgi:hypothetical protein
LEAFDEENVVVRALRGAAVCQFDTNSFGGD